MKANVNGTAFYYEQYGNGHPILMLHGWPADHRHMESTFEPFFQDRTNWRRIYLDLPGMGQTPGPDSINNQDDMLDAVLSFADAIIPDSSFAMAGVSYGGLLMQGIINRQPHRISGAAFIVPVLDVDGEERTLPEPSVLVPNETLLASLESHESDALQTFSTIQSQEIVTWLRTNFFPAAAVANQEFLTKIFSNFRFSFKANDFTEPFSGPALFLSGRQDSLWGYTDAWKTLPNFSRATYAVLDRSGHAIALEQPKLFRALMDDWLDRVEELNKE